MNNKLVELPPEELRMRVHRFYARYGKEIEQIAELLQIRLKQLALAYTLDNRLPVEAVRISTRVKNIESFLKKLENDGWPSFYYPTEVIRDLIGARVVCWFVDDVYGMFECIKASSHFKVSDRPVKDFIEKPQPTGYRALHVFANAPYDSVVRCADGVSVVSKDFLCEIQIRSKLQDAWGDITHEFFYKAKAKGVSNPELEIFLSDVAARLGQEDKTLMSFRDVYQKLTDEKTQSGAREGFQT
ncbi:RelA/SpoT domain-containing protein [Achromobacter xylosoxidans]|uniref:GTP pyrophosphokinase n=1 Tax=Alcaligenes xylosoxydans xylosoxydans TaxID=85698 RepID=UPI00320A737D